MNHPGPSDPTPNRLSKEKSPYLLQHAGNPVDWYPWGPEAFERAKREDKVIFLSIGYSTCYWCHVMERQVFEDPAIAGLMNELMVNVKVDREERPDVDRIYMSAVQAMTGGGGWPMSMFLTPDLKPFYGGTYIPPVPQHGRPGFPELIGKIAAAWKADRARILEAGERMVDFLQGLNAPREPESLVAAGDLVREAVSLYAGAFDSLHGGFGGAPKFPRPAVLTLLFSADARLHIDGARHMAVETLRAMVGGGIFDHLDGGFHRYSVDAEWRVPHFEKMLYDQAQIAVSCVEAWQCTRDPVFRDVGVRVLDYVAAELRDPAGGFYSAEDAESAEVPGGPKEEGTFYVWTFAEIVDALGEEAARIFSHHYGVSADGNALHDPMGVFGGKNILYRAHGIAETARAFGLGETDAEASLARSRTTLFDVRSRRPRPHLDDKILAAWNGLAISAFAKASRTFDEPRLLATAIEAARFLGREMTDPSTGRLFRRHRKGESRHEGGLQDYAFVVQGLIDLYEAAFDEAWLREAVRLTGVQIGLFRDADGAWYDTPGGDPTLLVRTREAYDGAEPAGSSVTALNLFRLARMTGRSEWSTIAGEIVRSVTSGAGRRPDASPLLLAASLWEESDPTEIVVSGDPDHPLTKKLLGEIYRRYLPCTVLLHRPASLVDGSPLPEFVRTLGDGDGSPKVYVCRNFSCQLPTSDPAALGEMLDRRVG